MASDPRDGIETFLVEPAKIERYLLNLGHPLGASKAARFLGHGFTKENLPEALVRHGQGGELSRSRMTEWGLIFEVDGPMLTPLNRYLDLRSVWEVRPARPELARLVTTYFRRS